MKDNSRCPSEADSHADTVCHRFSSIIDGLYDGVVSLDPQHRIIVFNQAAERIFGYQRQKVLGQHINILLPERFHHHHDSHIHGFKSSTNQSKLLSERQPVIGLRKSGQEFPVDISISKFEVNGETEVTAIVRDHSEQVRVLEELRLRASTDVLTGLKNREHFNEQAQQHVAESRRYHQVFSLLVVDIDHFKRINDTHGHAKGDQVLVRFAERISPLLRDVDIFVRYGGEEFVVLMPCTNLEGAGLVAERLRQHIDGQEELGLSYTLSIGVAEFDPLYEDIDEVFQRADKALYRAKKNGRNRVELG